MNIIEKETIGLCICLEAINDIVNHSLLDLRESSGLSIERTVYFKTEVHRSLYTIRFLDFVKETGDSKITGVSGSCLTVLKEACSTKSFNIDNSVDPLSLAVLELEQWLEYEAPLKLWLPSLDIEAKLTIPRIELVNISGNCSKHNLSRLTGISKNIQKILEKHGYNVPLEQIPLILDEFLEHLDENYFIYYASWISELLNNVRWGLQTYLQPTFENSYKKVDGIRYRYEYPVDIQDDIAQQWFWKLMNIIRSYPYVDPFTVSDYLKEPSSLET